MNVRRVAATPLGIALLGGGLVSAATYALWQPVPVGSSQDDGLYVILGKSLATGHGYRFINLPGAPQAVHYPPGFPALIALLWSAWPNFPDNALLFSIVNVLLLGAAAAGMVALARAVGLGRRGALVATLAGFLMPPMLALSATILSEPMWLALAIPWLLHADREVAREPRAVPAWRWLLTGVAAGALMLIRTQSASLVAGIGLVLLLRRRWTAAVATLAGAALAVLPWQLWVARHAALLPDVFSDKYGAYGTWIAEGVRVRGVRLFADAAVRNAGATWHLVGGMFSPPGLPAVLAALVLLPLIVAGAMRLGARAPVLLAGIGATFALILVYPFDPQRYVWATWPFVALWLACGFVELRGSRLASTSPAARWAIVVCVVLVAGGAAVRTATSVATGSFRNNAVFGARQLQPAVEWVRAHTAREAVITADDDPAIYLYTGRRTTPLTVALASRYLRSDTPSPVALDTILARYDPDFVIARWKTSVAAALQASQGPAPQLRPIAQLEAGVVFARVRPPAPR